MEYIIWILLGIALFILFIAIAVNKTSDSDDTTPTGYRPHIILYHLKSTMSQFFQYMLVREWSNDLEYTLPNRKK